MEHTFKLIDGTFTQKEATEILINLYRSKIQFHQMKQISSQERLGIDDAYAQSKILQLQEAMDQLVAILNTMDTVDRKMSIESQVQLRFVNNEA